MLITKLSEEAFQQDVKQAQRASLSGPVFVTKEGAPRYVLLSMAEYEWLAGALDVVLAELGPLSRRTRARAANGKASRRRS
jgi:PHD/YefM family antitoxin component YafN of YafNO toxin-antitoxin module